MVNNHPAASRTAMVPPNAQLVLPLNPTYTLPGNASFL